MEHDIDLEALLERNIQWHLDTIEEECVTAVSAYIQQTDSVMNERLDFIRLLTRVSGVIIRKANSLDEYLDKIHRFNIEGVLKIQETQKDYDQFNSNAELFYTAHLLSQAAQAAEKLVVRHNGNINWRREAYTTYMAVAELIKDKDTKYYQASLIQATQMAWKVIELIEDNEKIPLLEKIYDIEIQITKIMESDQIFSFDELAKKQCRAFDQAGHAAHEISKLLYSDIKSKIGSKNTQELEKEEEMWVERWLNAKEKATHGYIVQNIPEQVKMSAYSVGRASQILYKRTNHSRLLEKGYLAFQIVLKHSDEDMKHNALANYNLASIAYKMYDRTTDPMWKQVALNYYSDYLRSSESQRFENRRLSIKAEEHYNILQ